MKSNTYCNIRTLQSFKTLRKTGKLATLFDRLAGEYEIRNIGVQFLYEDCLKGKMRQRQKALGTAPKDRVTFGRRAKDDSVVLPKGFSKILES